MQRFTFWPEWNSPECCLAAEGSQRASLRVHVRDMSLLIYFKVADWLVIVMWTLEIKATFWTRWKFIQKIVIFFIGPRWTSVVRLTLRSQRGELLWSQIVSETLGVITAEDFIKESACLHLSICIFMQLCNCWQEGSAVIFWLCCLLGFHRNALKDLNAESILYLPRFGCVRARTRARACVCLLFFVTGSTFPQGDIDSRKAEHAPSYSCSEGKNTRARPRAHSPISQHVQRGHQQCRSSGCWLTSDLASALVSFRDTAGGKSRRDPAKWASLHSGFTVKSNKVMQVNVLDFWLNVWCGPLDKPSLVRKALVPAAILPANIGHLLYFTIT